MPRGDRTGPTGQGPRTGRAAGFCAGYDVAGCDNPEPRRGAGMGRGRGWGRGRGMGRGYGGLAPQEANASAELQVLRDQMAGMQARLDAVLSRLEGPSGDD